MDTKTYMEQFSRTVADSFFGNNIHPSEFKNALNNRMVVNEDIDLIKKSLFYNRKTHLREAGDEGIYWTQFNRDMLHAILGIDTESAELLETLAAAPFLPETGLKQMIVDETGDLMWYVFLLLKSVGADLEDVLEKNIAKLKARYPDGFTTEAALHRNAEKESAVFH